MVEMKIYSDSGGRRKACFTGMPLFHLLLSLVILFHSYLIMQGHINSLANEYTMEKTRSNANGAGVADIEHKEASYTPTPLLTGNGPLQ